MRLLKNDQYSTNTTAKKTAKSMELKNKWCNWVTVFLRRDTIVAPLKLHLHHHSRRFFLTRTKTYPAENHKDIAVYLMSTIALD